jgi:hypothetical protein
MYTQHPVLDTIYKKFFTPLGWLYFLLRITITVTNCSPEWVGIAYATLSSILQHIFCHKLMAASWSISKGKYLQKMKNQGTAGLEPEINFSQLHFGRNVFGQFFYTRIVAKISSKSCRQIFTWLIWKPSWIWRNLLGHKKSHLQL